MEDGTRIDPAGVAAVGHRLDGAVGALSRAVTDAEGARFGPHSVAPELREHGVAYADGMRELRSVVDAMAGSMAELVDRFDLGARALQSTDTDAGARIRAVGGAP